MQPPSFKTGALIAAAVIALLSVWTTWASTRPEVAAVAPGANHGLFGGGIRPWYVAFSSGDAVMVPYERDTMTTEAVLQSEQVRVVMQRIERRKIPLLVAQGLLVFVGLLFALRRIPQFHRP